MARKRIMHTDPKIQVGLGLLKISVSSLGSIQLALQILINHIYLFLKVSSLKASYKNCLPINRSVKGGGHEVEN
jgi:hypothetical protein